MDRNVVIATVLIAVIMFVWLWWIAPSPDQLSNTQAPILDTTEVAVQEDVLRDSLARRQAEEAARVDSTIAGAQEGEAQFVTVETDLYTARFSTKGATPVSFELKRYRKYDQQTPVHLVDTTGQGALALVFTTPTNHVVDSRSFYFDTPAAGDTLVVAEAPVSVTFEAQVGAGAIRQTYTFTPDSYEVGLQVEQVNAGTFATGEGYELVWDGGIPFSEGDPEKEAEASGAFGRSGGEMESVELRSDAYEEQRLPGNVDWVAVKSKYFTAVMIPSEETRGAELIGERIGEAPVVWEDYTASLLMPPATDGADAFRLYIGPMEFYRISDYGLGLYDMVDYGWDALEWLTRPLAKFVFIPTFTFLSSFIPNYGLVIIVFALLIKLVLYPLTKSSYKSMARMKDLQPKMEAIKERYADNPQKQQEAMMKMYREEKINPLGGCGPMLLQYPVLIALWMYLPSALEIRQQGFLWAADLSAPDAILHLPFTIPLYGNFVAGFTLLMGLSMVVQMKVQMNPSMNNAQAKVFTYLMPVMLFVFFNRLAAGLSLYYLVFNIVTALQQRYINRHIEKLKDAPGGANGKGSPRDAATAKRVGKEVKGKRKRNRS